MSFLYCGTWNNFVNDKTFLTDQNHFLTASFSLHCADNEKAMDEENEELFEMVEYAKDLITRNYTFEEVEKELLQKTNDEYFTAKIIRKTKKALNDKKRNVGVLKLLLGGFILIVGFIITVFCFHSNLSFHTVMYSFTTLGCLLLFWGIFEIIG